MAPATNAAVDGSVARPLCQVATRGLQRLSWTPGVAVPLCDKGCRSTVVGPPARHQEEDTQKHTPSFPDTSTRSTGGGAAVVRTLEPGRLHGPQPRDSGGGDGVAAAHAYLRRRKEGSASATAGSVATNVRRLFVS